MAQPSVVEKEAGVKGKRVGHMRNIFKSFMKPKPGAELHVNIYLHRSAFALHLGEETAGHARNGNSW